MIRVFFGVLESYGNSPGSIWALLGFRGKREERLRAAPKPSPNWTRGRGCAPSFLLFSSPFLDSYSYYLEGGGGILLPVGGGLLLVRPSWPADPLPLAPLYTGAGGTSRNTQVDLRIVP